MPDVLGFVKEDWQKIPANYRYIFLVGIFLIAMAWLGDHWGDKQQYHLPVFADNEAAFRAGFYIICFAFAILIVKQIQLYAKIKLLRHKYPLGRLNHDLYLVNFQGFVYLIDDKHKQRLHIKTPQTVVDLGFSLFGWEDVPIRYDAPPDTVVTLKTTGTTIRLGDYQEIPGGIYTQP